MTSVVQVEDVLAERQKTDLRQERWEARWQEVRHGGEV
jgi:hypothetical protein